MENNNSVKWPVFSIMITIFIALLAVVWAKLEKIDDALGQVRVDVAVIKQSIGIKSANSLLDRMYSHE